MTSQPGLDNVTTWPSYWASRLVGVLVGVANSQRINSLNSVVYIVLWVVML